MNSTAQTAQLTEKKSFAQKLTEAMDAMGLKPEDVALQIPGLKPATVRKWASGQFSAPTDYNLIRKLENVCGREFASETYTKRNQARSLADLAAA